MRQFLVKNKYQIILWVLISAYIAYFSAFSILRYRHLYAEYFDLGIMNQTVYNTYQAIKSGDMSRVLELTNPYGTEQIKRMAIHNDIILAFLAPFYFIHSGPETLLIIQTIVLALGAWAVYKIAQLKLKDDLVALAFAFAYLMYFPMQMANIFEFHAVTFATTFTLFMFYFWLKGRFKLSLLFLALALMTKEEVGLTLGMFGLYAGFQRLPKKQEEYLLPAIIILLSWGWALASVFLIIPAFRGSQHFATSYYDGTLSNVKKYLFNLDTLNYLFFLLGPLALLPLLAPIFIIIAEPEFAINLFSSNLQLRSLVFHYISVIQPWLFIGAIYGAKKVLNWRGFRLSTLLSAVIIFSSLLFSYLKSPLPYSLEKNIDPLVYDRSEEYQVVQKWTYRLAQDDIRVSSSDQIGPFFTSRRYFYVFSDDYKYADFVIVSLANAHYGYRKNITIPAYEKLKRDPMFEKVDGQSGYEVYRKRIN